MPRDPAIFEHLNGTDTLYAVVLTTGAWTATGAVFGDNSGEPTKYVFTDLADDAAYSIRVRAGLAPAATDRPIAGIPVPIVGGGSGGGPVGPGAIAAPVTIEVAGVPVDGAEVWVTTDALGENVIAGTLYTDTFGKVEFMLDSGTYFVWVQKAGINFENPTEVTV